jgi:hypothetical protein
MADSESLYKAFIDGLVQITPCVESGMVRQRRKWPTGLASAEDNSRNSQINTTLDALTPDQLQVIAGLLQQARGGGIHDVLVYLTDQNLRLVKDGVELAWEPFATEMYFDWVCRREGDDWPE